jgi:hypothetical protein
MMCVIWNLTLVCLEIVLVLVLLTPFLDTYPGSVECRSARCGSGNWSAKELPTRMVADEEIAEYG